jgi:ferritin-like metal-binding protein YciE
MLSSAMKGKLVQYFNEALATENAAGDRIQTRISETPVEQTKQQLQYHLGQTFQQQERLRNIITKLGGDPTTMKATLPNLMPMNRDTISNTEKETAKSLESPESRDIMDAEKELIQTKEDALIENAEIVSYKMLIHLAQEIDLQDAIAPLSQSLQEETAMVNFIMGNAPLLLRLMLPKLEASDAG